MRSRLPRGFTLVELLAVIAILAVLITLLVPIVGKARELAKKTVCSVNFKNTGEAFLGYAADHETRFPNKASAFDVEDRGYLQWDHGPWYPVWQNIINREYFKRNDPAYYPRSGNRWIDEPTCGPLIRFWTFWSPAEYKPEYLRSRYMACPNYKPWGEPPGYSNNWSRPWIANRMATGGPSWDSAGNLTPETFAGTLGKLLLFPQSVYPTYTIYALGTRLTAFGEPRFKYLVWEAERGSDILHMGSDGPDGGKVTLNADPTRPPWSGSDGYFSFRHVLPSRASLYQAQAQANALYVDGHVATLGPNDPVALAKRFLPD